jgi:comEA protein
MLKTIRTGLKAWVAGACCAAVMVAARAPAQAGSSMRTAGAHAGHALEGLVNINTATLSELQLLSGVGPAKAQRIAEYREKHPFHTVEELGRVKGIGVKTVRKLRPFLTVRGPTTAHEGGGRPGAAAASAGSPPAPPPLLARPTSDPGPAPSAPARDSLGAALPR